MMYQTFKLLCACYLVVGFYNPPPRNELPDDRYSLTVEIEGIIVNKGTLYVAMYNTEESFLKKPYKKRKFNLMDFPSKLTFKNLTKGEYAITIYQDLNGNKKLDKFFSIPIEPYGISNNVSTYPKFKNSKIKLTQNEKIKIKLRN